MGESVLGNAIELLVDLGFFDVVLPFLLVFTVVFGILEKTKVFGTEKVGDKDVPKKNINAMVAFVIGFFVVAAKQIVTSFQESLPVVSLVLVAIVSFLMLIGAFVSGEKELNFMDSFKGWKGFLAVVLFLSIVAIFFHSFGWLDVIYEYISGIGNEVFIVAVFVAVMGGVVAFVFKTPKEGGKE